MSITIVSRPNPPYYHVLKGGRKPHTPYLWTITVLYRAGDLNHRLQLKPEKPLHLTELSPAIEAAVNADRVIHGPVTNLRWTAISR